MEKGRGDHQGQGIPFLFSIQSAGGSISGKTIPDTDKCMRMPEREEAFCGRQGRARHTRIQGPSVWFIRIFLCLLLGFPANEWKRPVPKVFIWVLLVSSYIGHRST